MLSFLIFAILVLSVQEVTPPVGTYWFLLPTRAARRGWNALFMLLYDMAKPRSMRQRRVKPRVSMETCLMVVRLRTRVTVDLNTPS